MSKARFIITDSTGAESIWEETSPKDPTTLTVKPLKNGEIKSKKDDGPWTVSLRTVVGRSTPATQLVFPHNDAGTTASITLSDGPVGLFNVDVPK